jgi:PAS domain S-box-containing protein
MEKHHHDAHDIARFLDSVGQVTHAMNDAVIIASHQGMIVSWNPAAERIFNYEEQEVIGKPLTMIIPERYRSAHEAGIQRVANNGPHHVIGKTVELQGLRKDGTEFPLELSLSVCLLEGEKVFAGIIRDITARKQSENALRDAEHRFRSISESANDAIISIDDRGVIISWNQAATRIFGFQEKEALGRPVTIIIPDHYRTPHEEGIKRVVGGGPHHVIGKTVELLGYRKSGDNFPIELSLSTWTMEGRKYFCGIIRDITIRKDAERSLMEAEKKFRSITESANDAIISANATGCIVTWNRAAEQIFGFRQEEVTGKPLTMIIPEKYRSLHNKGIERVSGGGAHHVIGKTVELMGLHQDGHEFPIELSLSTWEIDHHRFYCGIIRDITARKHAEEQLQLHREKLSDKARKLRQANKDIKLKNEQLQALSNKLAKYLSHQVYKSIFAGKKDVKIESYRKNLTVFFSDIHGFTEMTDRVESEVLTTLLNKYLNEMSKIAIDHGGTIDKFIGDAIMIFFGDPETLGEKNDAIACVKMAIKMRERLLELRAEWDKLGIVKPLQVRMGINSGFCTVGNFGSEDRLDYTIVGSTVNLASRLETAANVDQILISHSTYALVQDDILCQKKEEIKVKGMAYPVQTYEVVAAMDPVKKNEGKLKSTLDGFNMTIDFNRLSPDAKLAAREILERVISKLQ